MLVRPGTPGDRRVFAVARLPGQARPRSSRRRDALSDDTLWPLPVVLPVTPGNGIAEGKTLALRDVYGNLLAFLHVEEIYPVDKKAEALGAYGTLDAKHPSVAALNKVADHYVAGRLEVLRTPPHYDFVELRRTPAELRDHFKELGWSKVVAFQTRNPLHCAHEELTKGAAKQIGGGLLIHPVVGVTKPGDVDHYTRVRCYRALVDNYYEPGSVVLSLFLSPCGWPVLARCSCTPSSAATTAVPTSSSAATMPGPGMTAKGSRSTRLTPLKKHGQPSRRDRHDDGRFQADGLPAR